MLQTDDVGNLFACLQAAYGHTWAHRADAVPIWQAALKDFSAQQVMSAANKAIEKYKDFPPTLPQFVEIVQGRKERVTTCLPPAPFDQVNHDKAMRKMRQLKDMPAYKQIGKSL